LNHFLEFETKKTKFYLLVIFCFEMHIGFNRYYSFAQKVNPMDRGPH